MAKGFERRPSKLESAISAKINPRTMVIIYASHLPSDKKERQVVYDLACEQFPEAKEAYMVLFIDGGAYKISEAELAKHGEQPWFTLESIQDLRY